MRINKYLLSLLILFSLGCSKNNMNIISSESSFDNISTQISPSINSSSNINSSISNDKISSSLEESISTSNNSTSNQTSQNKDENESIYNSSSNNINIIKHRILLISGHGGSDPGASYQNRIESKYNQEFVELLIKEIDKYNHYIEIILEPYPMKANEEAKLIETTKIDFALSIHFNAGGGKGSEMIVPFYQTDFTFAYEFFDLLENNGFILRETSIYSKTNNQKIKRAKKDKAYNYDDYFAVIRSGAKKKIPSYILEVEFIDNNTQMQKYDQRKNTYISLLAKQIVEYFN